MDVLEIVCIAEKRNASDLQLVVGSPPLLRVYGVLEPIEGGQPLTDEDITDAFSQMSTAEEREIFSYDGLRGKSTPRIGRCQ